MATPGLTAIQLAQEEGAKLGLSLSDEAADYILWEKTRFPMYENIDELREQVRDGIMEDIDDWRLGRPPKTGPTAWDKIGSED